MEPSTYVGRKVQKQQIWPFDVEANSGGVFLEVREDARQDELHRARLCGKA